MITAQQWETFISNALAEDTGAGDYSTLSCIPSSAQGKAVLLVKENGILAGMEAAQKIFQHIEPSCAFIAFKNDGDEMQNGETAFEINASVHTILQAERLVLNCMQRMSGIATLTRKYVDKLKGYHTRLLDTRKTTPNFRLLEKEAVRIGGGVNNRMGLYDMIMLKDNHIDYCGGIKKAILQANEYLQKNNLHLPIEIETRNLDEVQQVLSAGNVQRIMLDNFTPQQVQQTVTMIAGRFETEASGGITLDNIEDYAKTGVDYVSAGATIHHAVSLDLSLKAEIKK